MVITLKLLGVLAAIVVPFTLYYINSRKQRIEKVVEEYIKLANAHPPIISGFKGLIQAGINNLKSDKEIREAIKKIAPRVKKHPLGSKQTLLSGVDLKAFFGLIIAQKFDLYKVSIEEIVKRLK